jgi:hypothetical protein
MIIPRNEAERGGGGLIRCLRGVEQGSTGGEWTFSLVDEKAGDLSDCDKFPYWLHVKNVNAHFSWITASAPTRMYKC